MTEGQKSFILTAGGAYVALWLKCSTVTSIVVSSNSSCGNTFTLILIPLGKA